MRKVSSSQPFQAMEEEAYHAFREWPILLVMRARELAAHVAALTPPPVPDSAPEPESAMEAEPTDE